MLLIMLLVIFGVYALVKGEIKITKNRVLRGNVTKILGIIMLVGAGLSFIEGLAGIAALLLTIFVGLFLSEKPENN